MRLHYAALGPLALLLALAGPAAVRAQPVVVPPAEAAPPASDGTTGATLRAVRASASPRIDGRLDEPGWAAAAAVEGFRQREPHEGAPVSQRTVVRVLYDDAALYVGARLFDTAPDSIIARLGRRDDDGGSDGFAIFLDPFLDRRSGYFFGINAAGTLVDGTMSNDGNDDDSWDGVWEGKALRDGEGWTAELRIPYSQLRFRRADEQRWGVNFVRNIARKGEEAFLRVVPSSENVFVSYFADLTGIERITPPRGFEAVPYVTSRADFTRAEAGNPFRDGTAMHVEAGADLKFGVTPNLTLSATVNPDFGQVEVDPAVVNLSGFEVFFPERRPFFVEGSSNYGFGGGGSNRDIGLNWVNNDLFYTRRIGRSPQGELSGDYTDRPDAARILGAAKLTGRVGATNVGVLSSVTNRTFGRYQSGGEGGEPVVRGRREIEPLTHYGVVRALREFGAGRQGLGFMATAVNRGFSANADSDALRAQINGQAYAGGVDAWTQVLGGNFVLKGFVAGSHVRGTPVQIRRLQRSSVHFLQRPDRRVMPLDTARTSLSGYMTRVALDKIRGDFFLNVAFGAVTPGYDINDVGFLSRADVVNAHVFVGQFFPKPVGIFQRRWMGAAVFGTGDYDGDRTGTGAFVRAENTFRNFWEVNANVNVAFPAYDPTLTRGGPVARSLGGVNFEVDVETDSRRAWGGEVEVGGSAGPARRSRRASASLRWQPGANVSVSVGPEVSHGVNEAQYVRRVDDAFAALAAPTGGRAARARYVFAELDEWEVASDIRLNWTFTPTMSVQLFAQPLLASGRFRRFGELARARSFDFTRYGEDAGAIASTDDEDSERTYTVDPDGAGPAPAFSFDNPDFRFVSLRGNAVFRWEYRPGSTLFFVWTQQAEDEENAGGLAFARPVRRLFDRRPDNVFALKLTYWLGR